MEFVVLKDGYAKEQACEFAKSHEIDSLFVGQRGLGPIKSVFIGAFSSYMINHAPCDVVMVR